MNIEEVEKFTVYDSEAETVLEVLEDLANYTNKIPYRDHKGSWQGIDRPTLSEEGMRGTVEKHIVDIQNLQNETNDIKNNITGVQADLSTLSNAINTRTLGTKSNIIYLDDFPADTDDYSAILNPLISGTNVAYIICSPRDYKFKTTLTIKCPIQIIGNGSRWIYDGGDGSIFIDFAIAPWAMEQFTIDNISFWCGEDNQAKYQNKTAIRITDNHIHLKIHNCRFYCFGYSIKMEKSGSTGYTFGHSITECNFWGFIKAIVATGNAEQLLIKHCWFDDGYRDDIENGYGAIEMVDLTTAWIESNTIQNCEVGITLRGCVNTSIRDNHFENMIRCSILFHPNSVYENRNVVVDNNLLVGKISCIHHINGVGNVHCSYTNNLCHWLADTALYMFSAQSNGALQYSSFLNNSLRSEFTGKKVIDPNITNIITTFQNIG